MNKRGNYNNTPTERGCCHQPEPVLFSSPEKIRTGNENDFFLLDLLIQEYKRRQIENRHVDIF